MYGNNTSALGTTNTPTHLQISVQGNTGCFLASFSNFYQNIFRLDLPLESHCSLSNDFNQIFHAVVLKPAVNPNSIT